MEREKERERGEREMEKRELSPLSVCLIMAATLV
jgi:hypothetical protein